MLWTFLSQSIQIKSSYSQKSKKKKKLTSYTYIYTITLNLFYKKINKIKIINLKNPTLSETHAQTTVAKRKAEK